MTQQPLIVNNEKTMHFETSLEGGEKAFIEYRWYKGDLALMHTFVPPAFEGHGIASTLAHFALEYAKQKKLSIIVYCPFVAKYLKEHPEYSFLTDKKYTA